MVGDRFAHRQHWAPEVDDGETSGAPRSAALGLFFVCFADQVVVLDHVRPFDFKGHTQIQVVIIVNLKLSVWLKTYPVW